MRQEACGGSGPIRDLDGTQAYAKNKEEAMQTDGEKPSNATDMGKETERINERLAAHGDDIDMSVPAKLLESHEAPSSESKTPS